MAQVPDICVDIFSNIASMLSSLSGIQSQTGDFSHNTGFQAQSPESPFTASSTSPTSPESLVSWILFAVVLFFLMFGQRPARDADNLKHNNNNHPSEGDHNNDRNNETY